MTPAEVVDHPSAQRAAVDMQRVVALGLWLLSAQSYQWATLALVACAFGFTLWDPTVLRLVTASIFTLCAQVPVFLHGQKERTS